MSKCKLTVSQIGVLPKRELDNQCRAFGKVYNRSCSDIWVGLLIPEMGTYYVVQSF